MSEHSGPGESARRGRPTRRARVEVLVDDVDGSEEVNLLVPLVERAAEVALLAEHTSGPDFVTVLLSDDRKLRELNRQFKGEDTVTDVLSFNEVEGWRDGVPPDDIQNDGFVAPGQEPGLGEIVISVEQTRRQAEERCVPLQRELAMLTVHGVLHLLGYDHADPEEERVMFGKTDAVLERLFS